MFFLEKILALKMFNQRLLLLGLFMINLAIFLKNTYKINANGKIKLLNMISNVFNKKNKQKKKIATRLVNDKILILD